MASFLDPLDKAPSKWLRIFLDDLDKSSQARKDEIEKARIAGLTERANRLEKLHSFWLAHPEMEALVMLRSQGPELFDNKEHPEHKNLKEIAPLINTTFMRGSPLEIKDFEARVAAPATERIKVIKKLEEDPETYGETGLKDYISSVPGGGGSLKELDNYSRNPTSENKKFSNLVEYNTAVKGLESKYPDSAFPGLLKNIKQMTPTQYLANRIGADATVVKQAQIIKHLEQYKGYHEKQTAWGSTLKPHFDMLKSKLAESLKPGNEAVLNDWDIKEAEHRVGKIIQNIQPGIANNLKKFAESPEGQALIKNAFIGALKDDYGESKAAELWTTHGQKAILNNFKSETPDLLAEGTGDLVDAISETGGENYTDVGGARRIAIALNTPVYNLINKFTRLIKTPRDPSPSPNDPPPGGPAAEQAAPATDEGGEPVEPGAPSGTGGPGESPDAGSPGQPAPPVQPNPILNSMATFGYLATETGVYRKTPGAMPGQPAAQRIPDEELPILLMTFFGQMGHPEFVEPALSAAQHLELGVEPEEYFAMIPIAYTKFMKSVKKAHTDIVEADKAIYTAKDETEKQAALSRKEEAQKALESVYAPFGGGAAKVRKIGETITGALAKGESLVKIAQALNKSFNIPPPQPMPTPSQPGAQVNPMMDEKLKQEKIRTEDIQKESSAKEEGRLQKRQDDVEDRKLSQEERAHDRQMAEEKMALEQKEFGVDAQVKMGSVAQSAQIAQDKQAMDMQKYTDQKALDEKNQAFKEQQAAQQQALAAQQPQVAPGQPQDQAADPLLGAIDTLHKTMTPYLAPGEGTTPGQKIKHTQWNPKIGQHETTIINGDSTESVHAIDDIAMEGYGLSPEHRKLLSQDPGGQRPKSATAPTQQGKFEAFTPPQNLPPRTSPAPPPAATPKAAIPKPVVKNTNPNAVRYKKPAK